MYHIIPPPGFAWTRDGRRHGLVRSDLRAWLLPLLHGTAPDGAGWTVRPLAGGRGGTVLVSGTDVAAVVRPYRRGGMPARLVRDVYCGRTPRPFRELCTTERWRQRGAPVVEVYGAAVRWIAPWCYRGCIATRFVPGARTLRAWAEHHPPLEHDDVLRRVGSALRRLHQAGGRHPDLNVNNILVGPTPAGQDGPEILLIDFDTPLTLCRAAGSGCELARLRRSARKLDPAGQWLTPADLDRVEAAYRQEEP